MGQIMYEIFEKLLKEKGKKTSDVAKATGIPQQTFSAWKRRKGKLSAENLKKVADYFEVSMDYFAWGNVDYVATVEKIEDPILIEHKEEKTFPMYAGGNCYELPESIYDFVMSAIENYRK